MARGAPDGDDRADPLAELNDAQRRAAGAGDGVVRVIAGAGSGKTRTLVHRVAHLLARGVEPSSIVLLTFTRRAAHAMLARAAALADDRARRGGGGTFHGFAHQLLRAHGERLGYGASFTVLDREDALDRVDAARTEFLADRDGGRKRRFPRKQTIHRLLSMRINTGRALDALLADESPHFAGEADALDAIGAIYGQRKRDHDVMDYDDLLVNLRDLLRDHDDVRAAIGRRLRHVLVDEYQDTNRLQAHITALLAAEHGNLMVVGDDAQSIYAFRGAAVRNILDFTEIFPDAETIKLERNYRSTQPVLDLANAILAPSSVVIPKRLHTDRVDGPRPQLVRLADEHAQADFVARRILALRESAGVALGEIAVLFRAGWHAGAVELALGARNIPFRKFGGLRLAESAHVKDVTALLRVALNPREASAWFRMLQKLPGIGPRTAQQLTDALVGAKLKGDLTPLREASPRARRSASALADFLDVLAPALAVERSASAAARAEDVMPATDVAS
ncbi:MAG: ATP-dependent helicase, partial [Acidobacteriota bacterium]